MTMTWCAQCASPRAVVAVERRARSASRRAARGPTAVRPAGTARSSAVPIAPDDPAHEHRIEPHVRVVAHVQPVEDAQRRPGPTVRARLDRGLESLAHEHDQARVEDRVHVVRGELEVVRLDAGRREITDVEARTAERPGRRGEGEERSNGAGRPGGGRARAPAGGEPPSRPRPPPPPTSASASGSSWEWFSTPDPA